MVPIDSASENKSYNMITIISYSHGILLAIIWISEKAEKPFTSSLNIIQKPAV